MFIRIRSDVQCILDRDPAARSVWEVLTCFERFPEWNPFILNMEGKAEKDARLKALIHPPGGSAMTFKPKVLVAEPEREFRWLGNLLFPGLFDGEHFFRITDHHDGTCTLEQGEHFRGILVPVFKKMLLDNTLRGFQAMNMALKDRAEKGT